MVIEQVIEDVCVHTQAGIFIAPNGNWSYSEPIGETGHAIGISLGEELGSFYQASNYARNGKETHLENVAPIYGIVMEMLQISGENRVAFLKQILRHSTEKTSVSVPTQEPQKPWGILNIVRDILLRTGLFEDASWSNYQITPHKE